MKTILITGASRGIGRALAEKFLSNGDFVIGTSKDGKADFQHENLVFLPLDLFDSNSIVSCFEKFSSLDKSIDILINNAGIYLGEEPGSKLDMSALRKTLEVNLFGQVDLTERLLPFLNDGGQIVNLSSRYGSLSMNDEIEYPAYSISKASLNMYTKNLATRLKGQIIVSSVHPGNVKTDLNDEGTISPGEAADDIFNLIDSNPETGQFWFKGKIIGW